MTTNTKAERRQRTALRRRRLTMTMKRHGGLSAIYQDDIDSLRAGVETLRFLLVERNEGSSGDPPFWYSLHRTPARAAGYNVRQEYATEWPAVELIDLDTGARYEPIPSLIFRKEA